MSADDQSDLAPVTTTSSRPAPLEVAPPLAPHVADWLSRRVANSAGEALVTVNVLPGRWLIRVESGASASTIEQPSRGEHAAHEVVGLIRRWARGAGVAARLEPSHASEGRVSLTPPAPSQS